MDPKPPCCENAPDSHTDACRTKREWPFDEWYEEEPLPAPAAAPAPPKSTVEPKPRSRLHFHFCYRNDSNDDDGK
jgi:hypothetical protein